MPVKKKKWIDPNKNKNRGGRPLGSFGPVKLNETRIKNICKYLKVGCHLNTAAAAEGVSRKLFHDWLLRGNRYLDAIEAEKEPEPADAPYGEFVSRIRKAIAQAEANDLTRLQKFQDWKAIAWKLMRRYPKRWNNIKEVFHEHQHKHKGKVNVDGKIQVKHRIDPKILPLDLRSKILEAVRENRRNGNETVLIPNLIQEVPIETKTDEKPTEN